MDCSQHFDSIALALVCVRNPATWWKRLNIGELWYMMREVAFADDQMFKFYKPNFMVDLFYFPFFSFYNLAADST